MFADRPKKFRYLTQAEFDELAVPEKVAYLHDALEAVHKMARPEKLAPAAPVD